MALAHASGEFISFVDSDDVLPEDALAYEISQIGIADLLVCKSQKILENGKRIPTERELPKKIFSKEEMLWYLFDEERFGYLGYLCDKLYKTQIIKEKNILFDEKIRLNEDRLFLVEYVSYCKKIQLNNKVGYYYRQRLESAIGETRKRVTAGELTVIESFERMKALTRVDFSKVYYLICRRTFECGFTLYNRIPRKEKRIRQHLTSVMWKNALLYIQSPDLQMIDKIKVICHCLIKR